MKAWTTITLCVALVGNALAGELTPGAQKWLDEIQAAKAARLAEAEALKPNPNLTPGAQRWLDEVRRAQAERGGPPKRRTAAETDPCSLVDIESNAALGAGVRRNAQGCKLMATLAAAAALHGFRCDSISAARQQLFGGFKLVCNGFRYEYEIEDRGGNITVCWEECD